MLCMNSVPNIILLIEMFIIFIRPSSNMVSSKTVYTRLFAFLWASTDANCKKWDIFEKFRKFAT